MFAQKQWYIELNVFPKEFNPRTIKYGLIPKINMIFIIDSVDFKLFITVFLFSISILLFQNEILQYGIVLMEKCIRNVIFCNITSRKKAIEMTVGL